jgi:hypothetical protein
MGQEVATFTKKNYSDESKERISKGRRYFHTKNKTYSGI